MSNQQHSNKQEEKKNLYTDKQIYADKKKTKQVNIQTKR
jgi:hypothetical protein